MNNARVIGGAADLRRFSWINLVQGIVPKNLKLAYDTKSPKTPTATEPKTENCFAAVPKVHQSQL